MQGAEQNLARESQSAAEDNPVRVKNPDDRQQTARQPTSSFSDDVERSRVALGGRLRNFLRRNFPGQIMTRVIGEGDAIPASPSPLLAPLRYS